MRFCILAALFLTGMVGCADDAGRSGKSFQVAEPAKVMALMVGTNKVVELYLPRGCVITVEAEEATASQVAVK